MSFRIILSVILLFSVACSKQKKGKVDSLKVKGPILYSYKDIKDKEQAAMVGDGPVSWSQLMSQDPALQELQKRYDDSVFVFSYAWAKSQLKEGQDSLTLIYSATELDNSEEVLAAANVETSPAITVEYQTLTDPLVIALVGNTQLKWKDYIGANIAHSKLYRSLFNQRIQRLNGIVIRRHLLTASKAENLAMEAYVQKHIMAKELAPTESDVRAFAKDKGISETDLDESMIERLKDIVKQNDRDNKISTYVAKNLIQKPIQVSFPQAQLMVDAPELNDTFPQWGSGDGQLLYIGHWDCDKCERPLQGYLDVQKRTPKGVRGGFVYSFAPEDREARMGAEAGLCVNSISPNSHAVFAEAALKSDEVETEKRINEAVEVARVDADAFKDCFLQRKFQDQVDTHLRLATNLGVTQPPLLVVNGQVLEGPFDSDELGKQLSKLGSSAGTGLWQKIKNFFGF